MNDGEATHPGEASPSFAAIDLGATSGRVIVGTVLGDTGAQRVELTEVGRFPNTPKREVVDGVEHLVWDLPALWVGIIAGLRSAVEQFGDLAGIGIDSWAVDYGLLDADGVELGNPVNYRDERTGPVLERVFDLVSAQAMYASNGLQIQPFTTAFQLLAESRLSRAATVLLIPDLLGHRLTGVARAELTNASTTGLLDAGTRAWDAELTRALGVDPELLPEVIAPGELLGSLLSDVAAQIGASAEIPVWTVGSHDTASAVVAVPLSDQDAAYISCGTWSLVGLELPDPVLTDASRAANVTNEAGVDGTIRYLKNVMGLWVLSETLRGWEAEGAPLALPEALTAAREVEALRTVIDIDDPTFLPPGDMPARLQALAQASGQPVPQTPGEIVRCILDSLALAYRRSVRQVGELAGATIPAVHIVGGGVNNADLCQLTADATGLPVITGPIEGAALGNVLIQARAAGALTGSLADLRQVVARSTELTRYTPDEQRREAWIAAEQRAHG